MALHKCIGAGLRAVFIAATIINMHSPADASGNMRNITSMELVRDMTVGWNLGNTLDATSGTGILAETSWGNPKTTEAMILCVRDRGFRTIRIPVTWDRHFRAASPHIIDDEWMTRVQKVVNYAINNGMYVILNSHHDEWVTLTAETQTEVTDKITKIWTQIAEKFRDYDDHLVFEVLNEPRLYGESTEWTGGTAAARSILNSYNHAIVHAIRETGGNNALRHIMIPTHAAAAYDEVQDDLVIPEGDERIIVSQHTYWPYEFSMQKPGLSTWGSQEDKDACDTELDRIYNKFCARGIPVVIGEWGSIDKDNTTARVEHAGYYANACRERGILSVWWDNGVEDEEFGIFNRRELSWFYPEIADAIIQGAGVAVKTFAVPHVKTFDMCITPEAVRFSLQKPSAVIISILDPAGRLVFSHTSTLCKAGEQTIPLSLRSIAPGTYAAQIKTAQRAATQRFTIVR